MSEQAIHALVAKWRKDAEQFVLGSDWRDMLIAHADDLEVAALSQETCPELKTAVDALSALSQETPAPRDEPDFPNTFTPRGSPETREKASLVLPPEGAEP